MMPSRIRPFAPRTPCVVPRDPHGVPAHPPSTDAPAKAAHRLRNARRPTLFSHSVAGLAGIPCSCPILIALPQQQSVSWYRGLVREGRAMMRSHRRPGCRMGCGYPDAYLIECVPGQGGPFMRPNVVKPHGWGPDDEFRRRLSSASPSVAPTPSSAIPATMTSPMTDPVWMNPAPESAWRTAHSGCYPCNWRFHDSAIDS